MTLLAMERIKLLTTRSPYWCVVSILAAGLGFGMMISLISFDGDQLASTGTSQAGMSLGMTIFLVLATLAVTTEYRFGTIRTTFLAAPHRVAVFAAKTVIVVVIGVLVALVAAFASFFLIRILAKDPSQVLLQTGAQWRLVVGHTAVYALAGIIAVAVGALVRQSAGAIALLLVWSTLLEGLIGLIPYFQQHHVSAWMPFTAGSAFVTDPNMMGDLAANAPHELLPTGGPTPWQGLAVFAATAVVLWIVAAIVINRRDA